MSTATDKELLIRLAERVMGWLYWDGQDDWPSEDHPGATVFTDWEADPPMRGVDVYENGSEDVTRRWEPMHDIADAWMLVDRLVLQDWQPTLAVRQFEKHPEDRFLCHGCRLVNTLDGDGNITNQRIESFSAKAETMPRAICLAADRAVSR